MLQKYLLVFFVSMVPLIELRGSIVMAVGMDLDYFTALAVSVIGNMLPVPIIYFFARKVLNWGSKRKWKPFKEFCTFCLKKGEKGGQKLLQKTGKYGTYFALFLFVAIPLPGTGAWTGTLAASILNLDFKKTMMAIIAGVLTAGLIMLALSLGLFKGLFCG